MWIFMTSSVSSFQWFVVSSPSWCRTEWDFFSSRRAVVLSAAQRMSLGTMYTVPRVHVGRYFAGIGRFLCLGFNLPMPGSRVLRSSRVANYSKWRRESDRMERTGIHNPPK